MASLATNNAPSGSRNGTSTISALVNDIDMIRLSHMTVFDEDGSKVSKLPWSPRLFPKQLIENVHPLDSLWGPVSRPTNNCDLHS